MTSRLRIWRRTHYHRRGRHPTQPSANL